MIKGFLFDLDGVFYVSDRILDGANETLYWLKKKNMPYKFVTNTTTLSRKKITEKLKNLGLDVDQNDIMSANYAGYLYLKQLKPHSCKLILKEEAKDDYKVFHTKKTNPDVIVIGDIGNQWTYDLMNELLNDILNGAKIIALHKGRYFATDQGLMIDSGAFISGLEYVTQKKAFLVGKPNPTFFQLAIQELNISKSNICMVGDDLYNDIDGANNLGLFSVLVKTGKYRDKLFKDSGIKPNLIINSIASLPGSIKNYINKI